MIDEVNAEVPTIGVDEARGMLDDEGVVFVDLRDPRERARSGVVPGAFSCPRGMLEFWIDNESPYAKPIFQEDKTFVFYCASAWRSALATKQAQDMGLENACHMGGGFTEWYKAGHPVEATDH